MIHRFASHVGMKTSLKEEATVSTGYGGYHNDDIRHDSETIGYKGTIMDGVVTECA